MRSRWLLAAFVLLAGAARPGSQEAAPPPPLPEGNVGIASRYPGDRGIAKDPAVLLHDDFEDYAAPADVHKKWNFVMNEKKLRIAEEPANVHRGKRAAEFINPQQRGGHSVALYQMIENEQDVLFLRFYSKFEKGYDQHGSSHNGGVIAAHYFPGRQATPGKPADGTNKFLANFETERGNSPSPGPLNIYCYHPEQGGRYGDHIYPTGKIVPAGRRSPAPPPLSFGPHFVPRPDFIPELDRWYCYEFMVKANTPGRRDGRIAAWVDGKLIADFPNLRLRDVENLKIDLFGIALYMNPNTIRENKKWFDDVVAATSYIGPVAGPRNSRRRK